MRNSHIIGIRLKINRTKCNLKQKELAAKLNCDPATISRYETGKQEIPASVLFELTKIFQCSAEEFNPYKQAADWIPPQIFKN